MHELKIKKAKVSHGGSHQIHHHQSLCSLLRPPLEIPTFLFLKEMDVFKLYWVAKLRECWIPHTHTNAFPFLSLPLPG